jgi:signal transduction histidine kinase
MWDRASLDGCSLGELLAEGERERLELLERQRADGWVLPETQRVRVKRADGGSVMADVRFADMPDGRRILCARDVTEQTRAETLMGDLARLSSDDRLLDGPEALLESSALVFDALRWTVAFSEVRRETSTVLRVISPQGDPVGEYGRTLVGRRLNLSETPVLARVVESRSALFLDNVPALLSGEERRAAALSESMSRAKVARSAWCPVFDGSRVSHVLSVTGRDLTEHDLVAIKLFAAQLGAALQLVKLRHEVVRSERLAAVGEMAAVLAHEVRNPLAIVFNALATLRRTTSEAERAQLIDILGDEAERLTRLASDLLDFSHPGTASLESAEVGPLVEAALEQARHDPAYGERRPKVTVGGISGAHRAWVDPLLFRRALVNLLTNAFQHVPAKGKVTVTLSREVDEMVIRVHNEGAPVPPDVSPRVFEPFFTTKPTGTGLGLAIVRRISGDLGGSVELEDVPEGVTFALRVPAENRAASSLPPG